MKYFKKITENMSLRLKVLIPSAIIVVLLVLQAFMVFKNMRFSEEATTEIQETLANAQEFSVSFTSKLVNFEIELLGIERNPKGFSYESYDRKVKEIENEFNLSIAKFEKLAEKYPGLRNMVENVKNNFFKYKNSKLKEIDLIRQNKIKQAFARYNFYGDSDFFPLQQSIKNLSSFVLNNINDLNGQLIFSNEEIFWESVVFIFIFFLIIVAFYFANVSSIIKPLGYLSDIVGAITRGELNKKIEVAERKDEIGALFKSFVAMHERLTEVAQISKKVAFGILTSKMQPMSEKDAFAHSINKMIEHLDKYVKIIKEEISKLGSSAAQINSTIGEITASIAETSSAISETTSTVEEVRKTSEILLNKSGEAVEIADEAEEAGEHGAETIAEALKGFEIIKEQIGVASQNILRLSEHNQEIGEIVNWVKDIAEQSNLLAVNAAIEAARAGEEGKSFVVVAQEIKSLADQSKQATEKIKNILNEIQNGINNAVLATEKGEKVIHEQTEQAALASEVIEKLTTSLAKVRDVVKQNSLTTKEQNMGMTQIAEVMGTIKTASEQNAEASRQLSDAAALIKEIGEELEKIVSNFRLDDERQA
jgi:methyl-accepting chemotaxis protein